MAKRKPNATGRAKSAASNPWPAKLKALRARLKITQAEAAERIGVATGTWIAWENDQRTPGRLTQRLLKQTFPTL